MEVFYVDENPMLAAQALGDKHLFDVPTVLAVLSTAWVEANPELVELRDVKTELSKAMHTTVEQPYVSGIAIYKQVGHSKDVVDWLLESAANYDWLWRYAVGMYKERCNRFGSDPQTYTDTILALSKVPPSLEDIGVTVPPLDPDTDQDGLSTVEAHRLYYRQNKVSIVTWTNAQPPEWMGSLAKRQTRTQKVAKK
jgi:hypothetical protein